MPIPNNEEGKSQFIKRCIPILIDEGKPHKQAVAICLNIWNRHSQKQEDVFNLDDSLYLIKEDISSIMPIITSKSTDIINNISNTTAEKLIKTGAVVAGAASILHDILTKKPNVLSQDFKKPDSGNLLALDTNNNINKIVTRPQGVVICDTINNPIFPIPYPLIDDTKFNTPFIKEQYINIYTLMQVDYLPWHYLIEIINGKYYAFQTRPIDMKFPVNSLTAQKLIKQNNLSLSEPTKTYFKTLPFDLENAIHICIIGDTNKDVYIEKIYELIGRLCSGPFLRYFRMPSKTNQRVINFNLGNKFIFNKLDLYLSR